MKYWLHPIGIALAIALASPASAESTDASPSATEQDNFAVGMRVYIDPETGMLSPVPVTPEQMVEDELYQAAKKMAPMEELRRSDGTVTVRLNGNFEVASQLVIGPSGQRFRLCSDAAHAGQKPHAHLPPLNQPEER